MSERVGAMLSEDLREIVPPSVDGANPIVSNGGEE